MGVFAFLFQILVSVFEDTTAYTKAKLLPFDSECWGLVADEATSLFLSSSSL